MGELKLKLAGEVINEDNFGIEENGASLENPSSSTQGYQRKRTHFIDRLTKHKPFKSKPFPKSDSENQVENKESQNLDDSKIEMDEELLMPENDYLELNLASFLSFLDTNN